MNNQIPHITDIDFIHGDIHGRTCKKYRIMYYSRGELFMRSREGYFGVYFPSCVATREINTKITLEWAHKQFVTRVHTLFYFLHDITSP